MGENDARDELVGHATLAILALLGMGLYSATYALVYAGSGEASAVATLEFWMASVHLLSAVGCCACQALGMAVLQLSGPVPHVAEAQTALFLGVAAAVGTLSLGCIHDGGAVECGVYYGAAAVPRLASVGAVVWSVLVYAGSLGCQSWSGGRGGLSLGLRGASGVTATATMVTVPWVIQGALVRTCGDAWRVHLCADVRIQVDANVTASTVTADCSHIDRSLSIALGGTVVALLLAWGAAALPLTLAPRKRLLLTGLSGGTALLAVLLVWALQPAGGGSVRAPPPAAFHVLCAAFAGTTLCSSAWKLVALRRRAAAAKRAPPPPPPPPPTASTSGSLFGRLPFVRPSTHVVLAGGGGGDAARHRGAALPRRMLD
jgi:hypothetical protein